MALSDEGSSESVAVQVASESTNPLSSSTSGHVDFIGTSADIGINLNTVEANDIDAGQCNDDGNNSTNTIVDTNNNTNSSSNDNKTGGAVRGAIRSMINRSTIGQLPKHIPKNVGSSIPKHIVVPKHVQVPRQLPKIKIKAPTVSNTQSALSLLQKQKVPVKDVARISDRLSTGLQWFDTAQDVSSSTSTTSTTTTETTSTITTKSSKYQYYVTKFQQSAYRVAVFTTTLVQSTILGAAVFETYGSTVSYVATNYYKKNIKIDSLFAMNVPIENDISMDNGSLSSDTIVNSIVDETATSTSSSSTYYDSNLRDDYAIVPVSVHFVAGTLAGTVHGVGGIVFERISVLYNTFQNYVSNHINQSKAITASATLIEKEAIRTATPITTTTTTNTAATTTGIRTFTSISRRIDDTRTNMTLTSIRTKTSVSTGASTSHIGHTISNKLFNMKKFSLIQSGLVPTSILHHSIAHSVLFASYEGIKRTIITIQQQQQNHVSIPIKNATATTADTTTTVPAVGLGSVNYLVSVGIAGGLAGLIQHVVSNYTEVLTHSNVLLSESTAAGTSTTKPPTLYRSFVTHISATSLPTVRSCFMAFPPSAIGFIAFEYGKQFSSN